MAAKVIVYQRHDDLYDWELVGGNGEHMCGSVQGYTERNDAEEGFMRCAEAMSNTDIGIIYKDKPSTETNKDVYEQAVDGTTEETV